MNITDEQRALIDSVQGCPWCPDTKPGFDTGLEGHRDDPIRYAKMVCGSCGVFRKLAVSDEESRRAWANAAASGHPHYRELGLIMLPRLVAVWNRV